MSDLSQGLAAVVGSQSAYSKAAAYVSGEVEELFFSSGIQRQLNRTKNADVRVNLSRIAVDVVADRLEISALSCPDSRGQEVLNGLALANQFDLMLPDLFRMALEYGDAYLILDGDSEEGVTFYANNPMTVRVFYSPDNPWVKSYAIKRWCIPSPDGKGELTRVNLYYPDRIERFITKGTGKGLDASDFIPFTGADETDTDPVIANPYGFIPVWHFRTARPYGRPEHKDGYSVQDAINKLAITHLATIDYLGFPQRYRMASAGHDASDIDDFDADIFHDSANPSATEVGPGSGSGLRRPGSGLSADPGGIWDLPAGSQVGQFDAADSDNFINSVNMYATLLAQTTNTPLHYVNTTNDAPSGESLRVAEAPLVRKVRNRSLSFGGTLQDALEDALTLFGIDAEVTVIWASPESSDSMDTWQIVAAKREAGVPTYDAFLAAGMTPDQLEAIGLTPAMRVTQDDQIARLQKISSALSALGVAVTAGVVTTESAQQMVTELLGLGDEAA